MGVRIEMTLTDNTTKVYEEDQVVSANIFETNDPLSRELQINTFEATIYSGTGEFDFFNSSDVLDKMGVNQKVIVKYNLDSGTTKQIGVYYVDEWKVVANDQLQLKCFNAIGLLDKHIFREDFDKVSDLSGGYYIRYPIGQFLKIIGLLNNSSDLYDQNHATAR